MDTMLQLQQHVQKGTKVAVSENEIDLLKNALEERFKYQHKR